jgi:hypothetical protein
LGKNFNIEVNIDPLKRALTYNVIDFSKERILVDLGPTLTQAKVYSPLADFHYYKTARFPSSFFFGKLGFFKLGGYRLCIEQSAKVSIAKAICGSNA